MHSSCAALAILLAGCASAPRVPAHRRTETIALGQVATGSTAGWDWRDGPGGDIWTFVAPHTGSYRFHVSSDDHQVGIEIFIAHDRGGHTWAAGGPMNQDHSISLPLVPGAYQVNVDGNRVERGRYRLWVEEDSSAEAAVRAEDPSVVGPLCAAAASLSPGTERGVFQSLPGGLRASCGGTGGGTVYRLAIEQASDVRLEALAQFHFALEVRAACSGSTVACVSTSGYEAALDARLEPGSYFVVLDSTEIGSLEMGLGGADIRGAFNIERRAP